MIFKPITREEFLALSLDDRMQYLHRLMTDLRQKMADTREQQAAIKNKLNGR